MRAKVLATAVGCQYLMACSTAATPPVDANSDTAVTAPDAGPDASDAANASAETGNIGRVFAISDTVTVDGGTRASYRAGAYFVETKGTETATTTNTVGPCIVETITGSSTLVETDRSAGIVHITGGTQPIDLAPSGTTYNAATGKTALWSGGETLVVTADGKDVPAFSTSLAAPSKLTLTAPALPSTPNGSLALTRGADLAATWSGTSSGQVVLYFDAAESTKAYATTCTFNAKDGKGTVPAGAFADYPKGAGTFNFYVKEVATTAAIGWSIKFTASSAIVGAAGANATGSASFQ
jgi:hypothetical protein